MTVGQAIALTQLARRVVFVGFVGSSHGLEEELGDKVLEEVPLSVDVSLMSARIRWSYLPRLTQRHVRRRILVLLSDNWKPRL